MTASSFAVVEPGTKNKPVIVDEDISKELYLATGLILGVGFFQWDWGTNSNPGFKNEEFFGKNTKFGGADKMGHFYSAYLLTDLFSKSLIHKGWQRKKASIYSSLSAFALTTLVEIGDATSKDHGFSYEDQIFNTLGVLISYLSINYPSFDEKFDFKIEYVPTDPMNRLLDDYEGTRYITSLKFSGFDALKTTPARFLEFQVGYEAKGYIDKKPVKKRVVSVGLALNIGEILDHFTGNKTNPYLRGAFEYYQPPYTSVNYKDNLDD